MTLNLVRMLVHGSIFLCLGTLTLIRRGNLYLTLRLVNALAQWDK